MEGRVTRKPAPIAATGPIELTNPIRLPHFGHMSEGVTRTSSTAARGAVR